MKYGCLLDGILSPGGLSVVFQPVLQHRPDGWNLYSLEALVRGPRETSMESAEVLFEYVRRKRAEQVVDRRCVSEALTAALPLGRHLRVGVNVHASTLEQDHEFPAFLDAAVSKSGFSASNIIIEIVEHAPSWNGQGFARALQALREIGVAIAPDDVGLGHSNYRMILECRPDHLKVDRLLVLGSSTDYYRRAVLRSIAQLASALGANAIAEGVDNVDDLAAVLGEGFTCVQGYLLAKPAPAQVLGHAESMQSAARCLPYMPKRKPWLGAVNWLAIATQGLAAAPAG